MRQVVSAAVCALVLELQFCSAQQQELLPAEPSVMWSFQDDKPCYIKCVTEIAEGKYWSIGAHFPDIQLQCSLCTSSFQLGIIIHFLMISLHEKVSVMLTRVNNGLEKNSFSALTVQFALLTLYWKHFPNQVEYLQYFLYFSLSFQVLQ